MKPTIGRIVHFHTQNDDKPQAALVVDDSPKAGPEFINVSVHTWDGGRFSALLPAEEGEANRQGYYWRWPPRA